MASILIVDDDAEVLGTVWRALNREGHDVTLAESAEQARERIKQNRPDLVILDIMMPEKDGLAFCAELRKEEELRTLPILFLSAKWRTDDIVRGLDAGGDDYLTKPFELRELNARVRALLRRSPPEEEQTTEIKVGDLVLDTQMFQVSTLHQKNIQLTATEYRLLHHLMSSPDQAHSVHDLLDAVWQYPKGTGDPDLVRAHIRNLRAKIEPDTRHPIYIHTIHGVGYMVKS
ncbi:MAG TPA: response regulator transcription factor [Aggregatilineales bacterium]|nr:response regulator transcription factor [Aggregatilineales bacterium]